MTTLSLGAWLLILFSVGPFLALEAVFFIKLKRRERSRPVAPSGDGSSS